MPVRLSASSKILMVISLIIFSACRANEQAETNNESTSEKAASYPTSPPKRNPYPLPLPDSVRKRELKTSFKTPEEVCDNFLEAVSARDTARLIDMSVDRNEYLNWCWVEFGASDPKYNVPTGFAWENHYLNSMKGLNRILAKYGGKKLAFVSFGATTESDNYQSFRLVPKPILTVADSTGREIIIRDIEHLIEMNGRYKVFNYRD